MLTSTTQNIHEYLLATWAEKIPRIHHNHQTPDMAEYTEALSPLTDCKKPISNESSSLNTKIYLHTFFADLSILSQPVFVGGGFRELLRTESWTKSHVSPSLGGGFSSDVPS